MPPASPTVRRDARPTTFLVATAIDVSALPSTYSTGIGPGGEATTGWLILVGLALWLMAALAGQRPGARVRRVPRPARFQARPRMAHPLTAPEPTE